MVDVQRGVRVQALDDEVDGLLEGALLRRRRDAAVLVPRPEGVERGLSVRPRPPRLQDAEEVVHAVIEGEGVALQVQEEVVGAGLRQRQEALGRVRRAVLRGEEGQALEGDAAGRVRLHLEPRLLPDARRGPPGWCAPAAAPPAAAARPGCAAWARHAPAAPSGCGRPCPPRARGHRPHVAGPCRRATSGRRRSAPRGPGRRAPGVGTRSAERRAHGLQEATLHRAVVGRVRGDAEGGHLPRAAAEDDVHPLRVPRPGSGARCSL